MVTSLQDCFRCEMRIWTLEAALAVRIVEYIFLLLNLVAILWGMDSEY